MKTFTLKLVDSYADSRYDEIVSYYVVKTEKTLEEVQQVYEDAVREWEEAEGCEFDCKIAHIEMRLKENGMEMFPLQVDLELEF